MTASTDVRSRLQAIIRQRSLLTGGAFTLASGRESSVFFDMKRTMFDPEGAHLIAEAVLASIGDDPIEAVGGLVMGAVPIVAVVCAKSYDRRPLQGFFVRKEAKDHGTARQIDGNLSPGARVVILEDVTTTGGSALMAADAVSAAGAAVVRVITIVDRLEGAAAAFAARKLAFSALFTRDDFLATA
ncbi:MAG: orotate phosphoribosyltransferase [Rhodospirillales bacterium]|nr:orotate phosphoribosyltransferase [Rhodospirillales bacterium]